MNPVNLLSGQLGFVLFDHLLERVPRTKFGIGTFFQLFEVLFHRIPGKNLDIQL